MKSAFSYFFGFAVLSWAASGIAQSLNATPKTGNTERVRFVTDQQAGTVTITIDGVPAVRIDKTGMQVSGTITYSGEARDQPFPAGGDRGL